MRKRYIMLELGLFDGGAAGGGAGAGASGAAGSGGEAAVPQGSGKDGGDAAPAADGEPKPAAQETEKGQKTPEQRQQEFDALVSGEYKDLYMASVRNLLARNAGETQNLNNRLAELDPLVNLLGEKYGVTSGKVSDIMAAIDADQTFFEDAAMREGVTVEQYKRMMKMEAENRSLREAQKRSEQIRQRENAWKRWDQEAESCRQQYPGFDMQKETRNPDFVRLLGAGIDVTTAYRACHHDELVNAAMAQAQEDTKKSVAETIRSGYSRPRENQTGGNGAGTAKMDPANMTDAQIDELIRRARNGETIEF